MKWRNSEVHLHRRDTRSQRLNSIRSFGPAAAARHIALNPNQPCVVPTLQSEQRGDFPLFAPFDVRNTGFYHSVSTRFRSWNGESSSANNSILCDGAMDVICESPGIALHHPQLLLLEHQEAIYRQLILPEVDTWFTSLVEAAWDERDRLVLASEENVQRYWVEEEETKWRDSLDLFREGDEKEQLLCIAAQELCTDELVARSRIHQEYRGDVAEIHSWNIIDFQCAICNENSPRRDLPPTQHNTADHPPCSSLDEGMNAFLFGTGDVLVFVVDSENSVRRQIEDGEVAQRMSLLNTLESYISRTATLRRPFGHAALTMEEAETCHRRMLAGEAAGVFIHALVALELLHRRDTDWREEKSERKSLVSLERESWLYYRRAECDRRLQEEAAEEAVLRQHRIISLELQHHLAHQRELFDRSECDARFDITRRENRTFQLLLEDELEGHAAAQMFQTRFELRKCTVVWTPETYDAILLKETSLRGNMLREEREEFLKLKSREVSCYLHSHRNAAINRDVALQLQSMY